MPKKTKDQRRKAKHLQREAYAAAKNRRFDSFEPDMHVPQIRMRAAEDDSEVNEQPLTEEDLIQDQASIDARKQMLTVAMDKEAQKRQSMPFLGSVTQHTINVAKEADAAGAAQMEKSDWTHFHEAMYAKHLPFSSACYKLFRRACEGNALRDAEFVKLLLVGKLRESGRIPQNLADEVASKHVTKTQMYSQLRRDVEQKRATLHQQQNQQMQQIECGEQVLVTERVDQAHTDCLLEQRQDQQQEQQQKQTQEQMQEKEACSSTENAENSKETLAEHAPNIETASVEQVNQQ